MGRDPKVRGHYRDDAIAVNRIIKAIDLDMKCSSEWKAAVRGHLEEAMKLLLMNDVQRSSEEAPSPDPQPTRKKAS